MGDSARRVRRLPAESRSGRQLRARPARAPVVEPGALARDDGAPSAAARNANAVSGTGILLLHAVPVLRRFRSRTLRGDPEGTRRIPDAVPEHRGLSRAGAAR